MLNGHETFVIKPARGSQGDGITVIDKRTPEGWRKVGGDVINDTDLAYYLSNILSGMYSLANQPDVALVEYRVDFDPVFEKITYKGVPDIRVVVYRGVPAMAMLRLPTKESDGKANLHKGESAQGLILRRESRRRRFSMIESWTLTLILGCQFPICKFPAGRRFSIFQLAAPN